MTRGSIARRKSWRYRRARSAPTFKRTRAHERSDAGKEQEINQRIKDTLDDAVRFTEDSPDPSPEAAIADPYESSHSTPHHGERISVWKQLARRSSKRCATTQSVHAWRSVGSVRRAIRVTTGLVDEFGEARCLDTPISESAIIGVSIGASRRRYRPVAEIQVADFIGCGFDQIVEQGST